EQVVGALWSWGARTEPVISSAGTHITTSPDTVRAVRGALSTPLSRRSHSSELTPTGSPFGPPVVCIY
ncbi:MAG TPA: hypothetical protein VKA25_10180, partial [Gemmatimonadales bacterium]|nr:hypothetical protein [Gemmatimonadales bacterium]